MEQISNITGYEAVPNELKAYNNWICYKIEESTKADGTKRTTKIPYNPNTGMLASTTDQNTWADFNTAVACEPRYDGIGFVFSNTPFTGVDLDNISDELEEFELGIDDNIVGEFYHQLKTYTEVSPSGNGVHFIIKGTLPEGKRKLANVEMYSTDRYFTVTGDQLGDYDDINPDGTNLIKPLHLKYLGADESNKGNFKDFESIPSFGNGLSEQEVITALKRDKNNDRWIGLLVEGDWQACGYSSRSDAELALVGKLGFYSDYDKSIMDSIFKQSKLFEPKWERTKVYTIGRIIANRPKDGGYKSRNNLSFKKQKIDMKQLKENTEPPSVSEFMEQDKLALPDKNNVLWYLKTFASDREPEVHLISKYYNYENMAKTVTNLFYNEFSEVVEYQKDGNIEQVDDPYISEMYRRISQLYLDIPQKDLYHIVNNLGRERSYHPIQRLIESVEWDKEPRVETFFIDYFGLENTSFHREATRKWFIGAVARIYEPGIKFDMVPIVRGAQGTGKTTAVEKLSFGLDYYLSLNSEKVNDKDTMQLLRDSWLVELEELEFLKNNTDGSIKKFLSSRDDTYRAPYEKSQRNYKRHSVFIGTVNDKSFLRDRTGNRRYYPLVIDDEAVSKFNVFEDLTEEVVHQIWAEALTYYKAGETLICSPETEILFDSIRGNVMEEDVTEQTLLEFLNLEIPQEYYNATIEEKRLYLSGIGYQEWHINPQLRLDVTTREILTECFGHQIEAGWRGDSSSKRINTIMENLPDWKKTENIRRVGVDGKVKRSRGFKRK